MKKITLIAALLGSVYFANAQVGIGTPDPAVSAELEIFSETKGLLIPRVVLTDIKVYKPIDGAQVESLLVYNVNEKKDKDNNLITLPKGFYYWDGAQWNRIVSKSELDKVIEKLGDNITKIGEDVTNLQALINYIVPTNPGNVDGEGKPVVGESHTTIVYNPTTGEMSYVTYEGGKYKTNTINLTNMIRGIETNTFFIDLKDENGKITGYVYFNEATITKAIENALEDPANKDKDPKKVEEEAIKGLNAGTEGAIKIDVKGVVVNNIKEILESNPNITIKVDGKDKTFTTVEEYLQYITQFSEGNVIYKEIDKDPSDSTQGKIWVFQYYDKVTKEYTTINLNDLVAAAETKTSITRTEAEVDGKLKDYTKVDVPVDADVKKGEIFYKYDNEAGQPDYINMTGDILSSIENNEDIKKAITNVLNAGGNVYFGDHDGDDKDTAVTDKTPHVFYHVVYNDVTKKNENKEIELPLSMLTNLINKYKDIVKTALGDNITKEGDIVFTGNVYNGRYVYLAKGTTQVGENTARTSGVELTKATGDKAINGVLSIKLMKGNIVVATTATDIKVSGIKIAFNIGTAGQYIVVPTGDYDVVVEYTGDLVK